MTLVTRVLALTVLASILNAGLQPARAEPATIRLGNGNAGEEQMWLLDTMPSLALNRGQTYNLVTTRFQSADKRIQALEAGAIDMLTVSANGALFAQAEGVGGILVASLAREAAKGFRSTFYVKADSPIKSVVDLKGHTVGINGFSTTGHLWLKAALARHGMSDTDVTIVPVSSPAMQVALSSGRIDIGLFPQPFAALLMKEDKVRAVFDSHYGVPFDQEQTDIMGNPDFMKKNAVAVRDMLTDLKRALQYYLANTKQARQFLVDKKMVRVTPEVYFAMDDYYRDPDMLIDVEALSKMQQVQIASGFQKKAADVRGMVDLSYLK